MGFLESLKDTLGSLKVVGDDDGKLKVSFKVDHLPAEAASEVPHLEIQGRMLEDRTMALTIRDPAGQVGRVQVTVEDGALSVTRVADQEKGSAGLLGEIKTTAHVKETQRVKVPDGYDPSKMTTSLADDVLTVHIPPSGETPG